MEENRLQPGEIAPFVGMSAITRPDPPDEYRLSDEQTAEWWSVVNRMPADWFPRETHALLAQFCRHVVNPDG